MKKITLYTVLLIAATALVYQFGKSYWHPYYLHIKGKRTVTDVIEEYGINAENRLRPYFEQASIDYPPQKISLIAFKDSKQLELWAQDNGKNKLIRTYPILAASGVPGPKLREGDKQVPEGIYQIEYFNPNSAYHLSMKLNYPNEFDLKYAKQEGREEPGTNIFIHGRAVSIGCLAMGDPVIEELFTLARKVGQQNINVIISPTDPQQGKLTPPENAAPWVEELYQNILDKLDTIRT